MDSCDEDTNLYFQLIKWARVDQNEYSGYVGNLPHTPEGSDSDVEIGSELDLSMQGVVKVPEGEVRL